MSILNYKKVGDKIALVIECPECHQKFILQVKITNFIKWRKGELIQRAFPELTPDKRELLLSGICGECWKKIFGNEDE